MCLIDVDELKKRATKVMFRDAPECGEFDAVAVDDIDCMPTIDPETLQPTAHWKVVNLVKMEPEQNRSTTVKGGAVLCTRCEFAISKPPYLNHWRFCPSCGARMVNDDEKHCT